VFAMTRLNNLKMQRYWILFICFKAELPRARAQINNTPKGSSNYPERLTDVDGGR